MRLIEKVWFKNHRAKFCLVPLLLPLTCLFWLISTLRRIGFNSGLLKSYAIEKPVIIVGNIGVGGNGKTPVVVHLIELAKTLGLTPGVISRGYGGTAEVYPYLLDEKSTSSQAGDEPILIYQRCKVPVVVGSDRVANAQMLVAQGCDIIISDDGLQHYRLQRDLEIIVVDGKRLFGNGLLLPAGPLREGVWRLQHADMLIYNGCKAGDSSEFNGDNALLMQLAATELIHINSGKKVSLSQFLQQWRSVNAIAGIGDPQRFFDTLLSLGFDLLKQQGFVDHKDFVENDFIDFKSELPLLMTEKDAVKCHAFAQEHWWYLPVSAQLSVQDECKLVDKVAQVARCNKKF
ncbi:MAG: tetraacyldisaccharide 4'-kinase [Colwellia sp.]|nr:tetraacyldisaccharide 4'-kinase [Colwellia sp.]MCW8866210.1 tetraacyldisaccharide 4'-kinase [Colwellia sp.]MCW9082054.1 tetraacyldisaccharide 4'-kinase [Colwellia sp.]